MIARRVRDETGQASIEFTGTVWLLVLAGLIAWQLALVGWTAVAASNAARTAARAYSKSGDVADAESDGAQSLSGDGFTRKVSKVSISGETANVSIDVPIIVPDVFRTGIHLNQSATMPSTG